MITWGLKRTLAAGGALAAAGAVAAGTTAAVGATGHASAAKVTASGVDGVKLGATYRSLRADGLVRRIRPGCELAGPNTRSAALRRPLRGSVDFTTSKPRRVRNISITGGASARGVRVGSKRRAVRRAFPKVRIDRSTADVFGIHLAKVPRGGGGPLQFAIDVRTNRVVIIGVPAIAFCE